MKISSLKHLELTKPQYNSLLRYKVMAYVVGVMLILLFFVGIPLQVFAHSQTVVSVVGPVHGFLYIVYLIAAIDLVLRSKFNVWYFVLVVAAGFLPFLAFVVEAKMTNKVSYEFKRQNSILDK